MSSLRNKVQLIGSLGDDPQVGVTECGKKCAHFCLTTKEVYRNVKGEKIAGLHYHQMVGWGKIAEIAEIFLKKGREVLIEGTLISLHYIDESGTNKYFTEVLVNEILVLKDKTFTEL